MSISIKTAREIEKMRHAGELLEKVHDVRLVKNDTRKIEKGDDGTGRWILILPGSNGDSAAEKSAKR